ITKYSIKNWSYVLVITAGGREAGGAPHLTWFSRVRVLILRLSFPSLQWAHQSPGAPPDRELS
ncbi:MAG: hypothetical protein WBH24_01895, partial [Candidatus Acidiferrum sp.]